MIGKKPAGSLSIEERIAQIRKDAEAFIDERVKADKKLHPNLPLDTIKGCIVGDVACQCQQVLNLMARDEAEQESIARSVAEASANA